MIAEKYKHCFQFETGWNSRVPMQKNVCRALLMLLARIVRSAAKKNFSQLFCRLGSPICPPGTAPKISPLATNRSYFVFISKNKIEVYLFEMGNNFLKRVIYSCEISHK